MVMVVVVGGGGSQGKLRQCLPRGCGWGGGVCVISHYVKSWIRRILGKTGFLADFIKVGGVSEGGTQGQGYPKKVLSEEGGT